MRSWKKAVFFGGAVLVLAACGDATSPSMSKIDGPAASSVRKADETSTSTTTTTTSDTTNTISTDCNGSAPIHWGIDGTLVTICIPITTSF